MRALVSLGGARRSLWIASLTFVLAAMGANAAWAGFILSGDPPPGSFPVTARARNGNTGYEAVLFTPGDPSPGTAATQLNPAGAPIWNNLGNSYGTTFFDFEFTYTAATGTATWGIDFNHDLDYQDSEELATSVSPTLAGYGFEYFNLFYQGNGTVGVIINAFTLNGTNFGMYSTTSATAQNRLFEHNGGSYDILATGRFTFTGGSSTEIPRFWLQMGEPVAVPSSAVPEPASLVLWGSAGLMGLFLRRKKA